ncbi:MAG: choice-of-anchor tandem repeat GloVer-containing protein, partial [Candidatus Sulfotelmatobacter sp.]
MWKATPSGQVTALYTFDFNASGKFPNGENPVIGFAAGTDGNLYGITESGGSANAGVMYKLTPSGSFELLHNFCTLSGCPDTPAPIILGKDGNFYGAQFQTLFQLTPQGD